jgi:hypothetical protein
VRADDTGYQRSWNPDADIEALRTPLQILVMRHPGLSLVVIDASHCVRDRRVSPRSKPRNFEYLAEVAEGERLWSNLLNAIFQRVRITFHLMD